MTSLLILTSNGDEGGPFQDHFEEVVQRSLADVRITASGTETSVVADDVPVEEFDSVFLNPSPRTAIYARVLLESVHEGVETNLAPSALNIMAEKHYLFKVLSERNVPVPKTLAFSTEKGLTNAEESIDFPAVAIVFDGFERESVEQVEGTDDLLSAAERLEHGDNVMLVQEKVEGDLYDTLFIDGETISVKVETEGWGIDEEGNANYHSLPSEQEDTVQMAASAIGSDLCRIQTRGGKVINVDSSPRLERFQDLSGKNVYGKVAELLKGGTG
ncbi:MAG: hypothetical protein SVS85_01655 [Candidatus Nanohaloarchaea archaeon]|nr:hypothetical protein [Candidatus Nanohaloarchaea archaeon]